LEVSEFIIALLSSKPEGLNGRTTVQKLGYFASVILGKDMGYGPDFYGPYSSTVAANLQNLVENDFVTEKRRMTARCRTMYSYLLNDDAAALAELIIKENPTEYRQIQKVVQECDEIVHCNYNVLSWAAKVHFVLKRSQKPMSYKEAIAAGKSFGWKLGEREIDSAVKLLQAMALIKKV
jgi:uncharacterized protein YwgA